MDKAFKKLVSDKTKEIVREYLKYEEQVLNRVAYSIGCEPHDLYAEDVVSLYFDDYSPTQAANIIENRLNEEYIRAMGEEYATTT